MPEMDLLACDALYTELRCRNGAVPRLGLLASSLQIGGTQLCDPQYLYFVL